MPFVLLGSLTDFGQPEYQELIYGRIDDVTGNLAFFVDSNPGLNPEDFVAEFAELKAVNIHCNLGNIKPFPHLSHLFREFTTARMKRQLFPKILAIYVKNTWPVAIKTMNHATSRSIEEAAMRRPIIESGHVAEEEEEAVDESSSKQKKQKLDETSQAHNSRAEVFSGVATTENAFPVKEARLEGKKLWTDDTLLEPGSGRFDPGWTKCLTPWVVSGKQSFSHCLWAFECAKDDSPEIRHEGARFQKLPEACRQEGSRFEKFPNVYIAARRSFTIEGSDYMVYEILVHIDLPQ